MLTLPEMVALVAELRLVKRRESAFGIIALLQPDEQDLLKAAALEKSTLGRDHDRLRHRDMRDNDVFSAKSEYLDPVSPSTIERCVLNYTRRTSNAEIKQVVCMVCAQNVFASETTLFDVDAIPNAHILAPSTVHPAMSLRNGILLQLDPSADRGPVCQTCLSALLKCKLPPLSLANDMWIGEVPFELDVLTLPEQVRSFKEVRQRQI